jgi:uncharacterized lipoprotein YddW (UPF0748 family)
MIVVLALQFHLVLAMSSTSGYRARHIPMLFSAVGNSGTTRSSRLRGVWIATVSNIDWPAKPGLSVMEQQRDFRQKLANVQALHMNAVFVQVRPSGDAFYPSRYAPWSQYLTGKQGKNPGYDPLAFMLNEAHARHLAFHAWFNPYRVSTQRDLNALSMDNPARLHPDWVVRYGGKLYFNPGIPQVRELIVHSILEVVERYPIDGVHLDDYFYPYPIAGQDFADQTTYQQYGLARFRTIADWRRANVNQLIQELSVRIKAIRSKVQFGVSPFGVWRNHTDDPTGSDTNAHVTDYGSLYADTRTWIKNNWIDYIAPQIYWPLDFAPAAYAVLVPWWAHEVAGSHVRLYIGQAAYRIDAWQNPNELALQLQFNQRYASVYGSIFFSLKDVIRHASYFSTLW